MILYIVKRVLAVIPVFVFVAFFSFCLVNIYPGDFFTPLKIGAALSGEDPEVYHSALRMQAGIDKPYIVQFFIWLTGVVLHGDFGISFSGGSISRLLFSTDSGLHWTLIITIGAMLWAWLLGVPLGVIAAIRHRKPSDTLIQTIAYLGISMPGFITAWLFFWIMYRFIDPLIVNSGAWGLVHYDLVDAPMSWVKARSIFVHLLPAFVIVGAPMFASVVRYMKSSLMDTLPAQYLESARAKGVWEGRVIFKHALRNAFNPLVSLFGIMMPTLITGSIIATRILGLPSFGMLFIEGLTWQDQHLLTAVLLFYCSFLIVGNLFADLLLVLLDPRIRYT